MEKLDIVQGRTPWKSVSNGLCCLCSTSSPHLGSSISRQFPHSKLTWKSCWLRQDSQKNM